MNISFSTKKVAAVAAGLALAFSAVVVSPASAATADDLQAQISSLLAMIAGLQSQLASAGTTTPTTTGGSCTAAQFTLTHTVGDRGGDIINIQKFLNMDAATRVAVSGAGSPGLETSYFGPATKAAAVKFQNKYSAEVLAPVGLSFGTGYWGASSRAKANAMEIARCAGSSTDTGTGTTDPVATGDSVTVAAAAQPGNSLAPKSASNVPFTRFTLTAGDEDVLVENVTIELTGLAARGAFSKVMLLDSEGILMGNEETLDSDDLAEVGKDFWVKAGKTETFTVAATRDAGTTEAGEVASFSVVSINTDATVGGSLPITGAQHTINATLDIGTATLATSSLDTAVEIGDEDVELATLEITANGEDIRIMKVRFYQDASGDLDELLDNVRAEYNGDDYDVDVDGDYLTVDFGTDGMLLEEGDSEDLELIADIKDGAGDKIQIDLDEKSDFIAVGDDFGYRVEGTELAWPTITVGVGSVTLRTDTDFDNNEKIAAGSDKALLSMFEFEANGEDVTGDLAISFTVAGNSASTTDLADIQIDNVAVYKGDSRESGTEDTAFTAVTSGSTNVITFDDFTFAENDDFESFTIKGNVDKDVADGTTYEITQIAFTSIETESGEDVTDITKSFDHSIEIEGTVVTAQISSPSPAEAQNDKNAVLVAEIDLDADDSGDDVSFTQISMVYSGATSAEVTDCELFDGSTSVSSNDREDAGTSMKFSGLDIDVEKGTTKELTMKCDISSTFANGTSLIFGTLTFDAEGAVTGTDFNDEAGTGTSTVAVQAGTITAKVTSDDQNDNNAQLEDTNDVVLAIIEIEADQADVTVDTATTTMDAATVASIDGKVKLYVDGVLEESVDAATTMVFANLNIDLDDGEEKDFTFKADLLDLATSTDIEILTATFATEGAATTTTTGTFATVSVLEALPVLAQEGDATLSVNSSLVSDQDLLVYSIKAIGDDLVVKATNVGVVTSVVTTTAGSAMAFQSLEILVYSDSGLTNEVDSKTVANITTSTDTTLALDTDVSISEGDTYYFVLRGDIAAETGSNGTLEITDEAAANILFDPAVNTDLLIEDDIKTTVSVTL